MKSFLALLFILSHSVFSMTGVKVGTKAPSLVLKDTKGATFDLSKQTKDTVLVFYRGSWCPYCMTQLKNIETDIVKKLKPNQQLVAISTDKPKVANKMVRNFKFHFPVLSDPKAYSLKSFNIVNKLSDELVAKYKSSYKIDVEGDSGETHHMVAHPAVFIVKKGIVTFADVQTDYKKRTSNELILKELNK